MICQMRHHAGPIESLSYATKRLHGQPTGTITLESEGLVILVINLDPIEAEVCGAGGMLVRHRYSIAPGQHGAGERNGAQNAGYRNVAVQRTGLVELQQACVQPAMNPDEG